ncbi:MAG TPA: hypothetical protein VNL77_21515 [Roseiflexaceae bacterium]|nr:hypothetical protein [Roseiflexaceae bacterium]
MRWAIIAKRHQDEAFAAANDLLRIVALFIAVSAAPYAARASIDLMLARCYNVQS